MSKLVCVLLLALLLVPAATTVSAQDAPDAINDALADLSQRLGRTVTLASFAQWSWEQRYFADDSLGCPAEGQTYGTDNTLGYIFIFTDYDNVTYNYRVSADRTYLVMCVAGHPAEGVPPEPAAPSAAAPCDFSGLHASYLATRLAPGMEAHVTDDGIPNNVRQQPSTSADYVIQIPPTEQFAVLNGPMCNEGLVWWEVEYQGHTGWTVEGGEGEYWVEPLTPAEPVQPITPPATGRPVISATNLGQMIQVTAIADQSPNAVLFGGSWLITGTTDGKVRLWNTETGVEDTPLAGEGHAAAISALAFVQPLGPFEAYPVLASGDAAGVIILWDMATHTQGAKLEGHSDAITSLALSLDGLLLASGSIDGTVRLWDANTGGGLAVITANDAVATLTFNDEGTLLMSASADGTVQLWGLPLP